MSDTTSNAPSFNIQRVAPSTPVAANQGGKPNQTNTRFADKPAVRNIAPITEYNSETGLLDVKKGFFAEEPSTEQAKPAETDKQEAPAKQTDRHSQWKQEQQAKREAAEAKRVEKAAKNQALAKDYLKKGDLINAAKLLDMTPSDLATYVNNSLLNIPQEEKKLTPEEQRELDLSKFKEERLKFEEEQKNFKYEVIASQYIRDNITPEISNKDKYEFIHQGDISKISRYVYEYMNDHYQKTNEVLQAKDIIESIEAQMEKEFVSSFEKAKNVKKLAKYFQPSSNEQETEREIEIPSPRTSQLMEPTLSNKVARPLDSRFPTRDDVDELEEESDRLSMPASTSLKPQRQASSRNTPFAFLTREEKMALIRAGK